MKVLNESEEPHLNMVRPSYSGHPSGARVALQRCPILQKDKTKIDRETGKTIERLLSVDKWSESYLEKHVGQKNWTGLMMIVWFAPVVLTVISFFSNFSLLALMSLIGFIVVLVGNYFYMLRNKCPTCAIREECHSSF